MQGDEIEPLEQVGGGGFGRDVGINYSFGRAPAGTKTVRAYLERGEIYSDTQVTDWWFIVLSSGELPVSWEALDGRGSVIMRRDQGEVSSRTPTESPSIQIEPRRGPAGTRVKVTGDGFDQQLRDRINLGTEKIGLTQRIGDCDLIAAADVRVSVDDTGHLEGEFVIPEKPHCIYEQDRGGPLTPGLWAVFAGCRFCLYADFLITK